MSSDTPRRLVRAAPRMYTQANQAKPANRPTSFDFVDIVCIAFNRNRIDSNQSRQTSVIPVAPGFGRLGSDAHLDRYQHTVILDASTPTCVDTGWTGSMPKTGGR